MLDLQVDVSITTTTTVQALRMYHFYTCISFQNVMECKQVYHYLCNALYNSIIPREKQFEPCCFSWKARTSLKTSLNVGWLKRQCSTLINIAFISDPRRKVYIAVIYSRGKRRWKGNLRLQTQLSSPGRVTWAWLQPTALRSWTRMRVSTSLELVAASSITRVTFSL